jgi:predicted transcriptional regulator
MARSKVGLKSDIIDGLEKMPMTTHGVSRYVNCHYNTAKNRLEELQDDEVVEYDEEKEKWRLIE